MASPGWRPGSRSASATCTDCCSASSARGRSPSPAPSGHSRPAPSSRPPICRSPRSRSRPASRASGSSTTRSARYLPCRLRSCANAGGVESMADLSSAVRQCRRLLDLDADPLSVVEVLTMDRHLSPIVNKRPGLRAPGAVDGTELAIQAILGQQVSLAAARTLASRLVTAHGDVIKIADPTLTHLFPNAEALASADLVEVGVPATRRATLRALARAVAAG